MSIVPIFLFIALTSARPTKRDSQICYGFGAYTDSSYDVSLSREQELVTVNCCQMEAVYVSRWRKLENGKQVRLPLCRGDGDGLGDADACWKYQSRLLARLLVNATKLSREATFLCGKEPLWNDDFFVTTRIRLDVPPPVFSPEISSPRSLQDISDCNATREDVTCFSHSGRRHYWASEDGRVPKCEEKGDSGVLAACYEVFNNGAVKLRVFSRETKGEAKFRCVRRRRGGKNDSARSKKSKVCLVKVSWN